MTSTCPRSIGGICSSPSPPTSPKNGKPVTEETEAAGLTGLEVRQPVEAERGLSASFDVSRTDGPLSYSATLFASRINDPLHVERSPAYVLSTLPDPTTNIGLELLGTMRKEPFSVTATYTYVQARETVDAIKRDVPLTPRHSAGLVGMWEAEDPDASESNGTTRGASVLRRIRTEPSASPT
jgi:outer membrane receptor protein involved in Fe transport